MQASDIESLERATVAAVAPPQVLEIDGWLVPLDAGTMGRAKSAVPLRHSVGPHALDVAALDAIEAAYVERGLPPVFRIADVLGLEPIRAELLRRGYAGVQSTVFKVGRTAGLAALSDGPAEILAAPDDAWGAVFLGEGFDPVDGAHRVAALTRSPDAIYGAAGEDGRTLAVGVATFGEGWAGIHGMRTAVEARGRGLASRVLATLGRAAQSRGVDRFSLQVEEGNPARSLYRKAGFSEAWRYRYWRR
jgi:ribosomal protein S18 acetylase RimI-like enzyme